MYRESAESDEENDADQWDGGLWESHADSVTRSVAMADTVGAKQD
jgi:hypothetical protein